MDPQPQAIQPSAPQEQPQKNYWKIGLLSFLGILLAGGILFAGYTLGQKKSIPQPTTNEQIIPSPTPTTINDATANWQTYTIKSLGLTYKLPPAITALGDFQEYVVPGQQGTQIFISTENSKVTSDKKFLMGTTSVDYMAGRGGMFIDLQGFTKENGKYYAKFVDNKRFDLANDLVSEAVNTNGLQIIKIRGKSFDTGTEGEGLPLAGTPGQGHIGALININKPPYQGLAVDMTLNQDITEQLFDQILSTFKFTN